MSLEPQDQHSQRLTLANRVNAMCDEFEVEFKNGTPPDIEGFLRRLPESDQPLLLRELLALELDFRRKSSQKVDCADYVAQFPDAERIVLQVFSSTEDTQLSPASLADVLSRRHVDVPAAPLKELQQLAWGEQLRTGEFLIRQGEQTDSFFVIREGRVEIRLEVADGTLHVIDEAGPGEMLGEMALLTHEPRTASAVAMEPVRAAVLPAESFHQVVRRHPELGTLLTDLIAERLGRTQRDALTEKQLCGYQIRRRLGRGGMSVVYEAWDTKRDRRVALKMMSHRLVSSPVALDRFQFEADLIQRFDHPNIVAMYHRFAAFHTYFIVMEYCNGESLDTYLKRHGPMTESTFRNSLGQLARAVQYAHAENIVHRDIKPSNIMRLDDGTIKLMDFGIAEPISELLDAGPAIVGTPPYMAPEQRTGGAIDQRADYFSMGCVAYEMLTSSPLFARTVASEITRDFRGWCPPDLRNVAAGFSDATAKTVSSLLAVAPDDRRVDLATIANWAD